jgi:hypothetical protein
MKSLVLGLIITVSASISAAAQVSSSAISLECKSVSPFTSKFEGTVEISKLATSTEPLIENESGSADISLSRLETEVLPDGSARRIEIVDQLNTNELLASSEYIPAGQLFIHEVTIVTLNSSDLKASVRIVLEKTGANSTAVFNGAQYSATCRLK